MQQVAHSARLLCSVLLSPSLRPFLSNRLTNNKYVRKRLRVHTNAFYLGAYETVCIARYAPLEAIRESHIASAVPVNTAHNFWNYRFSWQSIALCAQVFINTTQKFAEIICRFDGETMDAIHMWSYNCFQQRTLFSRADWSRNSVGNLFFGHVQRSLILDLHPPSFAAKLSFLWVDVAWRACATFLVWKIYLASNCLSSLYAPRGWDGWAIKRWTLMGELGAYGGLYFCLSFAVLCWSIV